MKLTQYFNCIPGYLMSACYNIIILAHVTWVLAREWALFIRAAKTVTWSLTRVVGACPGHYGNCALDDLYLHIRGQL